ncbi:MAG: PilZ domain-containing protein [Desulfobacteraceae bacterium]
MATSSKGCKSPRTTAKWPITIITNDSIIAGESRNITANGIFTHCKEQLQENETYRMIIGLPKKRYLSVKGKLIWSNLNGIDPNGTFSDMGFSFMKLYGEDRHLLNSAISAQLA